MLPRCRLATKSAVPGDKFDCAVPRAQTERPASESDTQTARTTVKGRLYKRETDGATSVGADRAPTHRTHRNGAAHAANNSE